MNYNLNNTSLPEEEGRDLQIHVRLCAIRHAQTIDEIRKTNDALKDFIKELDEKRNEKLDEYVEQSNTRHGRNERVAIVAFFVIAASLWPQFVSVLAPIASAFTGFVVPAARAITGV